jgi:hypothetical protein
MVLELMSSVVVVNLYLLLNFGTLIDDLVGDESL